MQMSLVDAKRRKESTISSDSVTVISSLPPTKRKSSLKGQPKRLKYSKCQQFCCDDEGSLDEELLEVLGDQKNKKNADATDPDSAKTSKAFKSKKDGCSETGYFTTPQLSPPGRSLSAIRKNCKVTKNLPPPITAIKLSNLKQSHSLNANTTHSLQAEKQVSEINSMLQDRLSGTIALDNDGANELGEAIIASHSVHIDVPPVVLSTLVNISDTKRMSFTADLSKSRRKSSFMLKNVDLSLVSETRRLNERLDKTGDSEFISSLPKFSNMVKTELEANLQYTQRYIKRLQTIMRNKDLTEQDKRKKSSGNYLVVLYTTSDEKPNALTNFNCNLVRLILQHHCVAYDERDIALKRQQYKNELCKLLNTEHITVPHVFAKGISIGGVQVIFAMHKMKMIKEILKDFIMPPDMYVEWMYRKSNSNSVLSINIKLSGFPALKQLLQNHEKISLTRSDRKIVNEGKEMIKKARKLWIMLSKETYKEPCLLCYVQLKNTIIITYTILNALFHQYLCGEKRAYPRLKCCMMIGRLISGDTTADG